MKCILPYKKTEVLRVPDSEAFAAVKAKKARYVAKSKWKEQRT